MGCSEQNIHTSTVSVLCPQHVKTYQCFFFSAGLQSNSCLWNDDVELSAYLLNICVLTLAAQSQTDSKWPEHKLHVETGVTSTEHRHYQLMCKLDPQYQALVSSFI